MADLVVTAANVRPVNANQCIIRNVVAAVAIDVGEIVWIDPATGTGKLADASAAGTLPGVGVCVAVGSQGATVGAIGDMLSVVLFGPVAGFTLTPGDVEYVSDTVGLLADAVGTVTQQFGIGLADSILFVNPQYIP